MRPAGDIRRAARQAAWDAAAAGGGVPITWRDIAHRLVPHGVGREAVRTTVKNMARAGDLVPAELVRVQGSSRPLRGYVPADAVPPLARPVPAADAFKALTSAFYGRGVPMP